MAKGDIRDVWVANQRRLARKREKEREWAKANREKMNEYKRDTRAKKAAEFEAKKVRSAYHADWKGTTYTGNELKYRGLA
jgi:hypothetical protein